MIRGIIPARAGFTDACPFEDGADHGSSPLARGLPPFGDDPTRVLGIIPARAGFTSLYKAVGWISPDHPRSRGVYLRRRPILRIAGGSSPLARGLP